jgi:hypothetical protein
MIERNFSKKELKIKILVENYIFIRYESKEKRVKSHKRKKKNVRETNIIKLAKKEGRSVFPIINHKIN